MIACLAVDDEPLALELIEGFIDRVPYLDKRGVFDNIEDCIELLNQEQIDLIFLDINMPDISGIEFIRSLPSPPAFVLATAYNEYAIDGFDSNAIDYLLKPFSFERFFKASERARELIQLRQQALTPRLNHPQLDDFIMVKVEHYVNKIRLCDILYIEGLKDYVKIFLVEGKPVLTIKSMKSLEEMLDKRLFLRIHRSYIISIEKIASYRNGKVRVGDKFLPIGDIYRKNFQSTVLQGRV